MTLSERKKAILAAVINSYIRFGEPISSKALCDILDLSLSSATLRNEMSDLCSLGYLEQPHTSAGRIPTALGYKFYISDLMKNEPLSGETRLLIDTMLEELGGTFDGVAHRVGDVLSGLLQLPVIISFKASGDSTVKRVELSAIGNHLLVIVIGTSQGVVENRMLHVGGGNLARTMEDFQRLCNEYIIGRPLDSLSRTYFQTVATAGGISLMEINSVLFDMIEHIKEPRVIIRGESNLLHRFERSFELRGLIDLLSQKERMLSLLSKTDSPVGVVFGNDTGVSEFHSSTMVVAEYSAGDSRLGKIGVICPMRTDYESLIPSVEYFAKKMSLAITDTLKALED